MDAAQRQNSIIVEWLVSANPAHSSSTLGELICEQPEDRTSSFAPG
jgi:hypothetical protein